MASGAGARFGANKLLAEIDGVALIARAMDAYPPELFYRAVVVSRYPEVLALAERRGYLGLPNPGADEGISASIRLGMGEMAGTDGVLFAVCDQPWLTKESVERVMAAFEGQPDGIVALAWQGKKGNPCLFSPGFYGALAALTGDRGGGAVIRDHAEALLLVEASAASELWDVDTPDDLSVL